MERDGVRAAKAGAGPSSSAAGGSKTSPTSSALAVDNDDDSPRIQKRPRRTHARRSCQMCQQRKARCELPDLEVPSSSLPLPDHQACHRCRTLQISCIVDDANKRMAKKPAGEPRTARPTASKRRAPASAERPAMRKSSTNTSIPSNLGDTSSISSSSTSLLASGVPLADDNDLKFAGGRVLGDQIVYPAEARLAPRTPDSSSDEDDASSPPSTLHPADPRSKRTASVASEAHIKTLQRNPRDAANIDTWERFSTRSRPLTLLTELVPRQNGFASKVSRLVSARATIETDVSEIVTDEKSKQLSDWCEQNLTLWMPHISNAYQIRQEAKQGRQTLSTQLLEQVLYVVAMQHIRDPQDEVIRFSVTRFIIRDLARLMITSPRSSKAVEALELLALFPVDVSAIPGPSRNRIRTDMQISAAERCARSVRLDRIALTAAAPYSFLASTNQLDDFETKRTAMSWASVKTWYNCFTLGDDELYESIDDRFFSDDWSRSLILSPEEPMAERSELPPGSPSPENELFSQRRWSSTRRLGSTGLALRCLAMKQLLVAFDAINKSSISLSELERLANLSAILDDYERRLTEFDSEVEQRLASAKHGGQLLRTWITIESTAGHLLILGAGIFRGLGIDKKVLVSAHQLFSLIRGENVSPEMREFLVRYGGPLALAAEKVLVHISTLCRDAKAGKVASKSEQGRNAWDPTSSRWMVEGQSRTVLPMINLCGYALEAAFNAMEMHATMFKLWKAPPKRSESWQLVFSNVVSAMRSLDPTGSIQSGSIPATCGYILQGMLKVIVAWTDCSRKKEHRRTTSGVSAASAADDAIGRSEEHHRHEGRNGAAQQGQLAARTCADGKLDTERPPNIQRYSTIERYSTLLGEGGASRRNTDAVQAYGLGTDASQSRQPDAYWSYQNDPNAATAYRTTTSMFEADVPSSYQRGHVRGSPMVQPFGGPDATESLAAALPHSESLTAASNADPLYVQPQAQPPPSQQGHYFGSYRSLAHSNSSTLGTSISSAGSSHTHTPPSYLDAGASGGSGVAMANSASNGSGYSLVDAANGANNGAAAYDSLEFILNDVLGSSEWSGILQDIWRTDF